MGWHVVRYFCEHLGDEGYHKWVPHAESEGICESVNPSEASTAPLPPKFKVLIFGNSHLRQVRGTSQRALLLSSFLFGAAAALPADSRHPQFSRPFESTRLKWNS